MRKAAKYAKVESVSESESEDSDTGTSSLSELSASSSELSVLEVEEEPFNRRNIVPEVLLQVDDLDMIYQHPDATSKLSASPAQAELQQRTPPVQSSSRLSPSLSIRSHASPVSLPSSSKRSEGLVVLRPSAKHYLPRKENSSPEKVAKKASKNRHWVTDSKPRKRKRKTNQKENVWGQKKKERVWPGGKFDVSSQVSCLYVAKAEMEIYSSMSMYLDYQKSLDPRSQNGITKKLAVTKTSLHRTQSYCILLLEDQERQTAEARNSSI